MPYSVGCDCGRTAAVAAAQAGSTITCACGREVPIPRLSQLRAAAGETPVPQSVIERIRAMIANGELPEDEVCPYTGRRPTETISFEVQCERLWIRGDNAEDRTLIGAILLGVLGKLIARTASRPRRELGRDVSIRIPVRVASGCLAEVAAIRSQRKLKEMLGRVPIYGELLREYPEATVTRVK